MKLCRFKYIFCKFSEIGFLSPGKSTTTYLLSLISSSSSKGAKAMGLLGYYPIQGWWWLAANRPEPCLLRQFVTGIASISWSISEDSTQMAYLFKSQGLCWLLEIMKSISHFNNITRLQILIHLFSSIRNCFPNTAPGRTEFIVVRIWHDKF